MKQEKSNTKQRILQEAMKLFSINGFEAVSIRAIARAVGVCSSTLYKHFDSKQEILDEIVAFSVKHYIKMASNQILKIESEEDLLKVSLEMFAFQTKDEWMVMFRKLLIIEQFKNPQIAKIYYDFYINTPVSLPSKLFKQFMDKGMMRPGNEKVVAMELYAPFYLYHLSTQPPEDLPELFKEHIHNFWERNFGSA